jgi:DNA-binding NtrC family response regulator
MEPTQTKTLKMPGAMAVRTVAVEVTEGADKGKRWEGDAGVIGTAPDASLVLTDETVSRYHLRIAAAPEGVRISDVGSTNGTFFGQARIGEAVLPAGVSLRLGRTELSVRAGVPSTVELHDEDQLGELRGRSQPIRRLMSQVRAVGQSNATVLLIGETGTGKELVARAVHQLSPRAKGPFVTVDCASITPTLMAAELFGHEKGSFTGASATTDGAFARSDGGTVFLDEIGELPIELQSTLLGVLERRRFCRVGGSREIDVDVRVVAATNRDLRREVNRAAFRADLYYRLAVVTLEVPPLRDRPSDIPILLEHFAREEGHTKDLSSLISEDTLARLQQHSWPGNVRELKNFVLATLATGQPAPFLHPVPSEEGAAQDPFGAFLDQKYAEARAAIVSRFERRYLEHLLEQTAGNVSHAARRADMARSHLNDLLRRYGLR